MPDHLGGPVRISVVQTIRSLWKQLEGAATHSVLRCPVLILLCAVGREIPVLTVHNAAGGIVRSEVCEDVGSRCRRGQVLHGLELCRTVASPDMRAPIREQP